jgi:hypothetical protein
LVCHAGEKNRLRVFGNRELKGIFRSKTEKVLNQDFNNLYSSPNFIGLSVQKDECDIYNAWEKTEMHTKFLYENLKVVQGRRQISEKMG